MQNDNEKGKFEGNDTNINPSSTYLYILDYYPNQSGGTESSDEIPFVNGVDMSIIQFIINMAEAFCGGSE